MIALDDVKEHLGGDADQWAEEVIGQVLTVELAAQRSVLNLPSPRPAELDEALLRRVEHNLRTTGGNPLARVGIQGDGIRELERPWSKRSAPARPEDEQKPHGLPPVTKAAAKRAAKTKKGNN